MTYKLDKNYEEKVYAGVLGKIIGVFLGRPFENWSYERIMKELGPINYYVNDKLDIIYTIHFHLEAPASYAPTWREQTCL